MDPEGSRSDGWRKWWMGLLEKVAVAVAALAFTALIADRYQAAQEARRARHDALSTRVDALSEATLNYVSGLYDAYFTPCGKAGRARVHKFRDESYFEFINALEAIQRASHLFADARAGVVTRNLANQMRGTSSELYKRYVRPRVECGCAPGTSEVDDRIGPNAAHCPPISQTFATDFHQLMEQRRKLLDSATQEYRLEASALSLGLGF